jgi:DNA uptake protein ComE-like DNA-binding protein
LEEREMRREEKITKSHASGVVTLIFMVLFVQGVLFLFAHEKSEPVSFIKENTDTKPEVIAARKFDPNKKDKNGYVISPDTVSKKKERYITTFETRKREPLYLNLADSASLVALPGIGPYYARKIIQYRDRLGGFAAKEQLLEIFGIDKERLELFADRIVVDTNNVAKTDFNDVTFEELSRHPYLGGYVARSIIRYRNSKGAEMTNLANLVLNNIIKKELHKMLKYYFK